MRIECPQCEALFEAGDVKVVDGKMHFECSECQALVALQSESAPEETAEPAPTPSPADVAGPRCPKCSAPVEEDQDCAKCGLSADHFAAYASSKEDDADTKAINQAWQTLEGDWSSETAHKSFLAAARSGDYRAVAAKYRIATQDPERAERAEEMLGRIRDMATQVMLASKTEVREKSGNKGVVLIAMLCLLAVFGGGVYYMLAKHGVSQNEQSIQPSKKNFRPPPSGSTAPSPKTPSPRAPNEAQ